MAAPSTWERFLAAIRAQESGGNYSENVAGCLGAYCWNAQSNWDSMASAAGEKQYVGVNPSTLSPSIQDKVASTNLSRIYQQAGGGTAGYREAAMWWNGGSTQSESNPGLPAQSWAPHCGGGSSAAYACQVLTRMGLGGHYLAGSGAQSGSGGVVTTATSQSRDCLWPPGGPITVPVIPGIYSQTVLGCLVSKSEGRALLAVANLLLGGVLLGVGFGFVAAFSKPGRLVLAVASTLPGGGVLTGGARKAAAESKDKAPAREQAGEAA